MVKMQLSLTDPKEFAKFLSSSIDAGYEVAREIIQSHNKIMNLTFSVSPQLLGHMSLGTQLPEVKIPSLFLPCLEIFHDQILKQLR